MKKRLTNKDYEEMLYDSQIGMFFSNRQKLSNGEIVYSNVVKSEYWNFLTGFKAKTVQEFEKVVFEAKSFFKKIKRPFVFSINPTVNIGKEVDEYIKKNHTLLDTSVCMITDNIICNQPVLCDYSFRKIDNAKESILFVKTFKESKTQTLDTDVYDALDNSFFKALSNSFKNEHKWDYVHFVSEHKGKPVGMVSAAVNKDLRVCGLYGGGTYIKHRGKGVFSNLLKYVQATLQKDVKTFFLFTQKGSKNENLYKGLNFKTIYEIRDYK